MGESADFTIKTAPPKAQPPPETLRYQGPFGVKTLESGHNRLKCPAEGRSAQLTVSCVVNLSGPKDSGWHYVWLSQVHVCVSLKGAINV